MYLRYEAELYREWDTYKSATVGPEPFRSGVKWIFP
jgi:hypothetical protein